MKQSGSDGQHNKGIAAAVAILTVLALAVGCASEPQEQAQQLATTTLVAPTTTLVAPTTTTTESSTSLEQVVAALGDIGEFTRAWNENSLAWVTAFSDDGVSFEEYLRISYDTELEQRKALAGFIVVSKEFPSEMKDSVAKLIENYQNRVDALAQVIAAEVAADEDAFQTAAAEYYASSAPEAVMPIVEELLSTPEFAAGLAQEGASIDDVMNAVGAAFGVAPTNETGTAAATSTTVGEVDVESEALDSARRIDPTIDLNDRELLSLIETYVQVMAQAAEEGTPFETTVLVLIDFHVTEDGLEPEAAVNRIVALTAGAARLTMNDTREPVDTYIFEFLDWATESTEG